MEDGRVREVGGLGRWEGDSGRWPGAGMVQVLVGGEGGWVVSVGMIARNSQQLVSHSST